MPVNPDFEEFFASLHASGVQFLLIGGVAYNFHAPPRATKDIDIWVNPDRANLENLLQAIQAFGFPTGEVDLEELQQATKVLMLGRVPNRIDVLTRPDGLDFQGAWTRRVKSAYGSVPVGILSIEDLIRGKIAAGRPHDLADVKTLQAIEQHKGGG